MTQERRKQIVELINKKQTIKNEELISMFGISIETVRRDLLFLEKAGCLDRVYGGAVRKSYLRVEPKLIDREKVNAEEKMAIAQQALHLIADKDIVFFDQGTTVLQLAKLLKKDTEIFGFTASLHVAMTLSEKISNVTILGGTLRAGEFAVSGSLAQENMKQFNIDKAFIGVAGLIEEGCTDFIQEEAILRQNVIKNANQVIVLADHTKFGVRTMCNVCAIEDIDIVITDKKSPGNILKILEKKGVQVIIAND